MLWKRGWQAVLFVVLISSTLNSSTFSPGVRATSLGYAFTGIARDNTSLYWNPAGISMNRRNQFQFSMGYSNDSSQRPIFDTGILSFVKERKGAFAIGAYSLAGEDGILRYNIESGYAFRINKFFRLGASGYHQIDIKDYHLDLDRLGFAAGLLFITSPTFQLGVTYRSSIRTLFENKTGTLLNQHARVGIGYFPTKNLTLGLDYDIFRNSVHLGLEQKVGRVLAIQIGMSSIDEVHGRRLSWKDFQLHAGVGFLPPLVAFAGVVDSKQDFYAKAAISKFWGTVKRQKTINPALIEVDQRNITGGYIKLAPNLAYKAPATIQYIVQEHDNISSIQEKWAPVLAKESRMDTMALRRFINPANPNFVLMPRQVLKLPLADWAADDSLIIADVISELQAVVAKEGSFWPSHQLLAYAAAVSGQRYRANEHTGIAISLSADQPATKLTAARIYVAERLNEDARDLVDKVGNENNSLNRLADESSGYLYWKQGNYFSAIQAFEKNGKWDHLSPAARYYLADCYYQMNKVFIAEEIWQSCVNDSNDFFRKLSKIRLANLKLVRQKSEGPMQIIAGSACRHVGSNMAIEGESLLFPASIGKVYVWVKISNVPAGGLRVVPEWYHKNRMVFRGNNGFRVGASGRTFGYKTIHANQIGPWHVDFYTKNTNQYLGRIDFVILSNEDFDDPEKTQAILQKYEGFTFTQSVENESSLLTTEEDDSREVAEKNTTAPDIPGGSQDQASEKTGGSLAATPEPDSLHTAIKIIAGSPCERVGPGFRIEGERTQFRDNQRVYVWIKIAPVPEGGTVVIPEWYYKDEMVFRGEKGFRVGASGRTYGYKTIREGQTGPWHVDFYTKDNQFIGRIDFFVTSD